jgi:hypothetical protein
MKIGWQSFTDIIATRDNSSQHPPNEQQVFNASIQHHVRRILFSSPDRDCAPGPMPRIPEKVGQAMRLFIGDRRMIARGEIKKAPHQPGQKKFQ